jgi:hypothetical protein
MGTSGIATLELHGGLTFLRSLLMSVSKKTPGHQNCFLRLNDVDFPGNTEKVYFCIYMKIANEYVSLLEKMTITGWHEEACFGKHLPGKPSLTSMLAVIW